MRLLISLDSCVLRVLALQFEEARNVKLKGVNSLLRELCSNIQTLQAALAALSSTPLEQFQEADSLWEDLRREVKRLAG